MDYILSTLIFLTVFLSNNLSFLSVHIFIFTGLSVLSSTHETSFHKSFEGLLPGHYYLSILTGLFLMSFSDL